MYAKVFKKLLDSSIWLEPTPTRIVWLTLLVTMDFEGFAQFASVGNLARRAIVTLEEARAAVKTLEGPDPDSSDPENEGRRIERVPGGWIVYNAGKHRNLANRAAMQEANRIRAARHRARQKVTPSVTPTVTNNGDVTPSVTSTPDSNARVPPIEVEVEEEGKVEVEEERAERGATTTTSADEGEGSSLIAAALEAFGSRHNRYYRSSKPFVPTAAERRAVAALTPAQLAAFPAAVGAFFSDTGKDTFPRDNRHPLCVLCTQVDSWIARAGADAEVVSGGRYVDDVDKTDAMLFKNLGR